MVNFDYKAETKIYFGKGKENDIGGILKNEGVNKVYIIIGQGSVRASGLFDKVLNNIKASNIEYCIFEGVRPNPTIQMVREALKEVKVFKPDYLLAIGGGSVIDTAKSVASGYYYDGDPFDFNTHKSQPQKSLPVGVILTISAAGSEMSLSCVIQDDETGIKSGFNSPFNRPRFVIENPELTYSVSKKQTAYGVVDILIHTLERLFCPSLDNELSDEMAVGLIRSVIEAGRIAHNNPNDYEARATLMLASSLSHNGITGIGKDTTMPVHKLEHALSGCYPNIAHGAGLAVLFPKWARYYIQYDVKKFDWFARRVFDLRLDDKFENANKGINLLDEYFKSIDMPTNFKELGIENVDIPLLVRTLTDNGTKTTKCVGVNIDEKIAEYIYKMCL